MTPTTTNPTAAGVTQADRDAARNFIASWPRHSFADFIEPALAETFARHRQQAIAQHEGFQAGVGKWMDACFGEEITSDRLERADRFIEEALELSQTIPDFTAERAHALVDYVFSRPVGERGQEVGGTMVTLAALCNTFGLSIEDEAARELARIWTKVEQIRAKQAAKPTGSALPVAQHEGGRGEPVAWMYECNGCFVLKKNRTPEYTSPVMGHTETPLYAHPPATRPAALAEDEVEAAMHAAPKWWLRGEAQQAEQRADFERVLKAALSPSITWQAEEVARLREALKPFADKASLPDGAGKHGFITMPASAFRAARAALNEQPGGEGGHA